MEALQASGLAKRFEATAASDGVTIAMATGEVPGLLGPDRAGKTTLLRMLFGLVRPAGVAAIASGDTRRACASG